MGTFRVIQANVWQSVLCAFIACGVRVWTPRQERQPVEYRNSKCGISPQAIAAMAGISGCSISSGWINIGEESISRRARVDVAESALDRKAPLSGYSDSGVFALVGSGPDGA